MDKTSNENSEWAGLLFQYLTEEPVKPVKKPEDNDIGHYEGVEVCGERVWAFVPDGFKVTPDLWLTEELFHKHSRAVSHLHYVNSLYLRCKLPNLLNIVECLHSARIEGCNSSTLEVLKVMVPGLHSDKMSSDDDRLMAAHIYVASNMSTRIESYSIHKDIFHDAPRYLGNGAETPDAGEFRTVQCWIGGSRPSKAVHVPPPANKARELAYALDDFLYNEYNMHWSSVLIAGLAHAFFETIHPYRDGNGRTGRLLTQHVLGIQHSGAYVLPLSKIFFERRFEYYEALNSVRLEGTYKKWLSFFYDCVVDACLDAIDLINAVQQFMLNNTFTCNDLADKTTDAAMLLKSMVEENAVISEKSIELSHYMRGVVGIDTAIELFKVHGFLEEHKTDDCMKYWICPEYVRLLSGGYKNA